MKEVKKRIGLISVKERLHQKSGAGFTLAETLIIGALFGLFTLAGTLLLSAERARTRDMKRIADMTRLSAGFALLYGQKASYADAAAGCPTVDSDAAACTLSGVLSVGDSLQDPGKFSYTVKQVPDRANYAISFHLERSYGTLKAGEHFLTKAGIQ